MRRILLSTAKILISAALLYLALRKVDLSELFSRFTATSLFWIAMAIAVTLLLKSAFVVLVFVRSSMKFPSRVRCRMPWPDDAM